MSLTLITGRANTGKTGVVLAQLERARSGGRYPVLLLPTRPDAARATATLAAQGVVGADVRQFGAWIADLWGLYGDGRTLVTAAQRLSAAQAVAEGARPGLLEGSAATAGFPALVARVAARMAAERADWTGSLTPPSGVDRELARLLTAYRERLAGLSLVEAGEAVHVLSAVDIRLQGPVFVARFDDLDPSQEALLCALARVNDVYVALTWERDFPATEALDGLVERLAGAAAVHTHIDRDTGGSSELDRLEAGLFRAPEPGNALGAVRFCTATGDEAECALIAAEAAEAAAGFGPGRVAVVFRDPARRVEALRAALEAADIPAVMDVMVPALRTPLGRALKTLLDAVSGPVDPSALLSFMRSRFSGADISAADELDARWRGRMPPDGPAMLRQASRLGRRPARAIHLARRLTEGHEAGEAGRIWQALTDTMLRAAHEDSPFDSDPDAALDGAVRSVVLQTALSLADGGRPSSWREMRRALEQERVSTGAGEVPGRVQVTEAHRLRSRRFDAVIVGGLTAGDFSSEGRTSAAEQVVARLLGTDEASQQARDRMLFYGVATRARERLVLVRQTADTDGTPKRPSVFWEEVLDLYRPATPDADSEDDRDAEPITRSVNLSDLERVAPSYTADRAARRLQASHDALPGFGYGPAALAEHLLTDHDVLARLAEREEFSATELEKYARCPYRWFYERMIRPESLDASFGAMERGDIAHRALAAFYDEAPARLGSRRVTRELLPDALDLAEEVFDRVASDPRLPAPRTLLERDQMTRTRAQVIALIGADVDFLPGFEPASAELRFGTSRDSDPADGEQRTHGPVDLGGFLLRGSIDRIDEGPSGLVIVDYKSGSSLPKRADFAKDVVLQVPLYAAVARVVLERPVVAGFYRSIRSGEARGFFLRDGVPGGGFTGTDAVEEQGAIEEIIGSALGAARLAADGIRAGRIEAEPATAHACDYCPAQTSCGSAT